MTSKEKKYSDLRIEKLQIIIGLIIEILVKAKKEQLRHLNLNNLGKIEQELELFVDLLNKRSNLSGKVGLSGISPPSSEEENMEETEVG